MPDNGPSLALEIEIFGRESKASAGLSWVSGRRVPPANGVELRKPKTKSRYFFTFVTKVTRFVTLYIVDASKHQFQGYKVSELQGSELQSFCAFCVFCTTKHVFHFCAR